MSYQQNGESQYFTCGDEVTTITFVPELPRGLSLLKGVLKGAPERSFTNLRVKLSATNAYGFMWLNCITSLTFSILARPNLTDVGTGIHTHTIYKDAYLSPIRFYPDSYVRSFSISPALPDGIYFDEKLGMINGTYQGEVDRSIVYTVTAAGPDRDVQSVFTLNYKGKAYERIFYPRHEFDSIGWLFSMLLRFLQLPNCNDGKLRSARECDEVCSFDRANQLLREL